MKSHVDCVGGFYIFGVVEGVVVSGYLTRKGNAIGYGAVKVSKREAQAVELTVRSGRIEMRSNDDDDTSKTRGRSPNALFLISLRTPGTDHHRQHSPPFPSPPPSATE